MHRRKFISNLSASASALPFLGLKPTKSDGHLHAMAEKIIPERLQPGDTIGLLTPATYLTEEQLRNAVTALENLGFKVRYSPNMLVRKGYLGGTDKQRAEDINQMFADEEIDGIMCGRGGYGSGRILPYLDFDMIRNNPKPFIGFSDITALLYGFYGQAGLVCYHGPMGTSDYNEITTSYFKKVLMEPQNQLVYDNQEIKPVLGLDVEEGELEVEMASPTQMITLTPGQAEGELIGGNLSLMSMLAGTQYDLDMQEKLVFIEEVGEAPYRIDRMLTQLLLDKNKLPAAAGIVLGVFNACEAEDEDDSLSLAQVLQDRLAGLNIPVIYGLSFGHIKQNMTLPFGINARLDASEKKLTLLEKPVA
ncbi:muramoyltetrapeptide carboxypeptidase [Catalinimonas alkaloidigena]|uniref:S66 peptidase family protein n=1 Tax=Catalinimonas alkaloidigena TaxID=1075417 RepID=UPI002406144D|nr:LD-carboxypeptidase [Catalinimonas alkaloidigena]MDF9800375.1 muramoyltetrapeptide carboxypeptidase [Catalinimonas alkaloidigena]